MHSRRRKHKKKNDYSVKLAIEKACVWLDAGFFGNWFQGKISNLHARFNYVCTQFIKTGTQMNSSKFVRHPLAKGSVGVDGTQVGVV